MAGKRPQMAEQPHAPGEGRAMGLQPLSRAENKHAKSQFHEFGSESEQFLAFT